MMRFLLIFILLASPAISATRIWYEDCEATYTAGAPSIDEYNDYFLEWNYGSGNEGDWQTTQDSIDQYGGAYAGSYCMGYQPFIVINPEAHIGLSYATYGQLSEFNLDVVESRYWYFRWWQKYDGATSGEDDKLIYINHSAFGTYTAVIGITKTNSNTLWVWAHRGDDYDGEIYGGGCEYVIYSTCLPPAGEMEDGTWHKYEFYIDFGTTGGDNGEYRLWFDDEEITGNDPYFPANWTVADMSCGSSNDTYTLSTSITFHETIPADPIRGIEGWPSNTSGTAGNTQWSYYDELEMFTLTSRTDIPSEGGGTTLTPPTNLQASETE